MTETARLYDEDFVRWSQQQAEALRAAARGATNQPIDWENVAEEIESLGKSDRRELGSQIRRIIEHLLKIENLPVSEPRAGWIASIDDARNEVEVRLEDSPSLRTGIDDVIASETRRASRKAVNALRDYGELDRTALARLPATVYTRHRVLGDWFPPAPGKKRHET